MSFGFVEKFVIKSRLDRCWNAQNAGVYAFVSEYNYFINHAISKNVLMCAQNAYGDDVGMNERLSSQNT